MRILSLCSIDTTTELALIADGVCVQETQFPSSSRLSEQLWYTLRVFLDKQGWALEAIDLFSCVRGPGSYTSLRVGLAAMDGLAWSLGKPVIGFLVPELDSTALDPSLSRATRCGLLACDWLNTHPTADYTGPVLPEYGAEFRLGGR